MTNPVALGGAADAVALLVPFAAVGCALFVAVLFLLLVLG